MDGVKMALAISTSAQHGASAKLRRPVRACISPHVRVSSARSLPRELPMSMVLALFLCARVAQAHTPAQPARAELISLEFVESSTGLGAPALEMGRAEIELGDVNGDGHVDIVSIGDHGSPTTNPVEHGIMVYFGDGRGAFSVFQSGHFGYGGVALGDVDGDGAMDVGYAMHHNEGSGDFGNQLIEVARGDGTGKSWLPWDDGLATNGESYGMFGTDFADV